MLIGGAQAAVEREHLGARQPPASDGLLGVADLVLPAEEDEHVTVRLSGELVEGGVDALKRVEVDGARFDRLSDLVIAAP
jgi:hypothetical protein